MTTPDDRPDRPDDEDRAWAELVEVFHASTDHSGERRWPAAEDLDPGDERTDLYGSPSDALTADDLLSAPVFDDSAPDRTDSPERSDDSDRSNHSDPSEPPGRSDDDGRPDGGNTLTGPRRAPNPDPGSEESNHFIPPSPPPIPRGDLISRLAWAGIIGPPSLILLSALLSISMPINVMGFLAIAFVVGFATLVYRMRGRNPYDPDDGAVL